ncbi:hypothetical protein [Sphingobium boeckii]|uniref:EthD domain-containing protein n=1 Tax=Sphingobium boeckii TaxID=1082345 RepID=A0A7W9AFK7_9SPHN|nr:hypothetical protein [Sphingobium boeckii]MBB5684760.1 hypothetical protein [Sphingobium boeckii]
MPIRSVTLGLALCTISQAYAAPPVSTQNAPAAGPVTVEYYYRVRWGAMDEFLRLYRKNHEPILREMKKAGWITRIEERQPFTHMAGGQRWDIRVTIVYRDAESAVGAGGRYDEAALAVTQRLYPDGTALALEEAKRFSLIEEHWDVVVKPVSAD